MRSIIGVFYWFIILYGCTPGSVDNGVQTIKINLEQSSSTSIKEVFPKIEIIKLETNDSILIKRIIKVLSYDDMLIVLDYPKAVHAFDLNGNYLYPIGREGRGPDEYVAVADIGINQFNNCIEILEPMGRLKSYSLKGSFLDQYQLHTSAHSFLNIDEDRVLLSFYYGEKKLQVFSKKTGTLVADMYPMSQQVNRLLPFSEVSGSIINYQDKIFYQFPLSNEIFEFEDNRLKLSYTIDAGRNSFELDDIKWDSDRNRKYYTELLWNKNEYAFLFHGHVENESYIFKKFLVEDGEAFFLHDKKGGKTKTIMEFLEGVDMPIFYHYDEIENTVFAAVDPFEIEQFITDDMLDQKNKNIFDSIDEGDNPVIVKYHFLEDR